jgi:hypothetical protein
MTPEAELRWDLLGEGLTFKDLDGDRVMLAVDKGYDKAVEVRLPDSSMVCLSTSAARELAAAIITAADILDESLETLEETLPKG